MATRPTRLTLTLLAAIGLATAAAVARADVIRLTGGGVYRGRITGETEKEVTIETAIGPVVVPRREIERIERDESARDEFQRRFEELRRKADPDGYHALGVWARDRGLGEQAEQCFRRAISLDSFHRPSREALGHRFHQGRWYTPDDYRRVVEGLVEWEGRWITREEKERLEQGFVRDEQGNWVRPEDLARRAEEERLAGEARGRPAGAPVAPAPGAGQPGVGQPGAPRPGPAAPPPASPAGDGEDTAWYRDNEAVCAFDQAPTVTSRFYEIRTNVKPEYARRYGEIMDRYYLKFLQVFGAFLPRGTFPKSTIWVYSSQREFMSREGMSESVGGFYNTGDKRVTAFHGMFGMSGTTRTVLAHEGTHQFEDLVLQGSFRNAPIWILEGLAVFFESAYWDGKDVVVGLVPRDRLAHLKRGVETNTTIPLADLIRTPQQSFTAYHYAHAWGLIYMILYYGESKPVRQRTQQWFSDLFMAARSGPVTAELVEERLGGREKLLELEERWKQWIRDLPYDYDPR